MGKHETDDQGHQPDNRGGEAKDEVLPLVQDGLLSGVSGTLIRWRFAISLSVLRTLGSW